MGVRVLSSSLAYLHDGITFVCRAGLIRIDNMTFSKANYKVTLSQIKHK